MGAFFSLTCTLPLMFPIMLPVFPAFQCWFGRNVTCDQRGTWTTTLTTMGVCHTYTLSEYRVHLYYSIKMCALPRDSRGENPERRVIQIVLYVEDTASFFIHLAVSAQSLSADGGSDKLTRFRGCVLPPPPPPQRQLTFFCGARPCTSLPCPSSRENGRRSHRSSSLSVNTSRVWATKEHLLLSECARALARTFVF